MLPTLDLIQVSLNKLDFNTVGILWTGMRVTLLIYAYIALLQTDILYERAWREFHIGGFIA